jgi:hypothetical protein
LQVSQRGVDALTDKSGEADFARHVKGDERRRIEGEKRENSEAGHGPL